MTHDIEHLRARADELYAAAATARDPEIARALEEMAVEFEVEARLEAAAQGETGAEARPPPRGS